MKRTALLVTATLLALTLSSEANANHQNSYSVTGGGAGPVGWGGDNAPSSGDKAKAVRCCVPGSWAFFDWFSSKWLGWADPCNMCGPGGSPTGRVQSHYSDGSRVTPGSYPPGVTSTHNADGTRH